MSEKTKQSSGRYEWKPINLEKFTKYIKDLRDIGQSDSEIAKNLGLTDSQFRDYLNSIETVDETESDAV